MRTKLSRRIVIAGIVCLSWFSGLAWNPVVRSQDQDASPLVLVVMDPLSAPLACDCVQGYAQRKYEKLGLFLAKELNREVKIAWAESLPAALKETGEHVDIVIGKHSVALAHAENLKIDLQPVASLTDKEGLTSQHGLLVVRNEDPAQSVSDLKGYRLLFGMPECDEKYAAPIALLRGAGVEIPESPESFGACSVAATKMLELPAEEKAAAVISSYAAPLLEGCGTIKKGALRVVGKTEPVRFITAFINQDLDESLRTRIAHSLLLVGEQADLLIALETDSGFEPFSEEAGTTATSASPENGGAGTVEQKKN